jgi:DNA-binding GntR family transcriptional regulator
MANLTLPEQIADKLRRDILLGRHLPGSSLKERDNAVAMGVSRTPMREAIRILAKEGLVVLRPSRSPIVADPTLKEVMDDVTVMCALEVLSSELACENAASDEVDELEELHRKMTDISGTANPVDFFDVDMRFHRAIAAASHNSSLRETHQAYLARLWRARYLSASRMQDRPRVLREHGDIVGGLRARDKQLVGSEIRSHLRHLVLNISALFEQRENQGG